MQFIPIPNPDTDPNLNPIPKPICRYRNFPRPLHEPIGGAKYETSISFSIFRQADYVHQALLGPLCYVIKPPFPLATLPPHARHGAEHDIFF